MGESAVPLALQQSVVSPYVMTISRRTVDHVGLKLYDKVSNVIAELVANSYDGDANEVIITIPLNRLLARRSGNQVSDYGLSISVRDNGRGISKDLVNEIYLKVGRNTRNDKRTGPKSPERGRVVMGRKGIGKLAPFGVCKIVEVHSAAGPKTLQGFKTAHFTMSYDDIISDSDAQYLPPPGADDGKFSPQRGTTITLRNFLSRRTPDAETFQRQLCRIFGMESPDFKVTVVNSEDGSSVVLGTLPLEVEEETMINLEGRDVSLEDGTRLPVKGWVAYSKKPYKNEEMAGVRIYSTGRIVASTRDFGLKSGFSGEHTIRSYFVGSITADWLDEDEDLVHTGRQDILWDSEKGAALKKWGQDLVKELGKKAFTPMRQKAYRVFLEKSNLEAKAKERFGEGHVSDSAVELGRAIGQTASLENLEDQEYVDKLTEIVLNTAPHKMMVDKLKEVAEVPLEDPLSAVVAVFNDAKLAEAASMGLIAVERVDAIEKLEEKIGKIPAVDELDLQGILEGAPWLIHPEWTVLQANKTFDSLRSAFERWYEKNLGEKVVTTPIGSKSRPDFVMLPVMGNIEIVEIKKADHALTDDEFKRFRGYYDAMEKFLDENPDFRTEFVMTHVTLLCDKLNISRDIQLAYDHLVKENILTRKTWEEILAISKKRHEEFIERRYPSDPIQLLSDP